MTISMELIVLKNRQTPEETLFDILHRDYVINKMTLSQLADKYGVSLTTVQKAMRFCNIPRRHITFA